MIARVWKCKCPAERVEVVLITFWESIESLKGFAGEDVNKAVLYEEDYKYGIEPELTVEHYTVADIYLK